MTMSYTIEKLFRAPCGVPNALQTVPEGLWIADQITDRVALIEMGEPSEYGVTKWIRDIDTESSNTSGMAVGQGSLWLGANGSGKLWRPLRCTDADQGEVLQVDPETGATQARHKIPGEGGVHGIEYDHIEPGHLWVTTLRSQTLTKMRIDDWSVSHTIPLPHVRAHGVVRVRDGVWVVHTADRVVVKLAVEDGAELARIVVPESDPQPHGLCIYGDDLLYCDATSGWVVRIGFG
ncbi:MAG: hypothetical protein GKR89_17365 [Candidatus Latescibacteria bacterium]|nr:hypothetical protein [Candidatus Latescibacterota bacterium]